MRQLVHMLSVRLHTAMRKQMEHKQMALRHLMERPWRMRPKLLLSEYIQRSDRVAEHLHRSAKERCVYVRNRFEIAIRKLELLNPVQLLYRGFSIVEKQGRVVRRSKDVHTGDHLTLTFADGKVPVVVADGSKETDYGA